jgi:hypothetical protein
MDGRGVGLEQYLREAPNQRDPAVMGARGGDAPPIGESR